MTAEQTTYGYGSRKVIGPDGRVARVRMTEAEISRNWSMSGDGFAERCDLVADAFGALSHLDAKVCPSSVPVGWGEQVPRVVVGNATTGTVLVTLGDNGWQISGGSDPRTRIVVGEDLVESVAALLRGERLEAPAYADWTGEEVNR